LRCLGRDWWRCRKYQLSLDGLRETHDRFRKPGSFSAANIDEIPQLIDVIVEHKADIFAFGRYCPTSEDRAHQETWHIEPQRYREFLEKCWTKFEQYKDSDTTFNLKDHLWTLFLYEKGLFKIPEGLDDDTIYDGCNCGNCHFTISAEGRLMTCRRFNSYVGTDMNLFELIKHRRSIRKYEDWQVPREDLERIIEAGLYAPNADKILDAHFPQCPIRNVIARIGDRWSILILLTLEPAKEPMRFKELEQAIYQQPHRLKVVPSVNTKVW